MKPIGFIGLGKLGLAVSVALSYRGVKVIGHDLGAERIRGYIANPDTFPAVEAGVDGMTFPQMLGHYPPRVVSIQEVAAEADLIFVAVQTPHQPKFDGTTQLPSERADFDYSYLRMAIIALKPYLAPRHTVVVISTCLPGTMRREVLPILDGVCPLVYNPYFIAMGTVVPDFLNPEFILLGEESGPDRRPVDGCSQFLPNATDRLTDFYEDIGIGAPARIMSYESAELTKVAYNAMISLKISYANMLMDLCDRIPGANVDDITNTIKLARVRLISDRYLTAGMGDGGGCHPRDGIAMSWLMNKLELPYNLFDDVMNWREQQARVIAMRMMDLHEETGLPLAIFGTAFKPNTKMLEGSPALLVQHILEGYGAEVHCWDPLIDRGRMPDVPGVILIGCRHDWFKTAQFAPGSVVVDPFRYIPAQDGIRAVGLGRCTVEISARQGEHAPV